MPPGYTSKLAPIPEDTTDTSTWDHTSRPKTPTNISHFPSNFDEIKSTPARATLGGYQGEDHTRDVIRPQLKKDMEGTLGAGLPFDDYIEAVWGLNRTKLHEDEHRPCLSSEELARYRSPALEKTRYIPFTAILAQLLLDYLKYMRKHGHMDEIVLPCGVFFEARVGDDVVHGDGGSQRKPDASVTAQLGEAVFARLREIGDKSAQMLTTTKDKVIEKVRLIWAYLLSFFEFKKKGGAADDGYSPMSLDTRATVSELPKKTPSSLKRPSDSSVNGRATSKRRKKRSSHPLSIPSSSGFMELIDTRKTLNADELQAADYAHESLRTGHRRYSTGIFVDDDVMTLWYYDRMGPVRSKPFNFVERPDRLLAVVVALASATIAGFGFEPMICTPGPSASLPLPTTTTTEETTTAELEDTTTTEETTTTENKKTADLSRSKDPDMLSRVRQTAELTEIYEKYRSQMPPDENLTDCYFRITSRVGLADRPLFDLPSSASFPTTSRSSSSILSWVWDSLKPKTGILSPLSDVVFKIKGRPLYVQDGLVGRGTVVLHVETKEDEQRRFPSDIIAKISWPPRSRIPEDSIIRHVRFHVPKKWKKHITNLACSTTLSMPEETDGSIGSTESAASASDNQVLDIPRRRIMSILRTRIKQRDAGGLKAAEKEELSDAFIGPEYEERVLRVLVCEKNLPLNRVQNLDEFKSVFVDVVKAHYVVYTKAGILHRDLSVNNIMFTRDPVTNRAIGVLNDWDLAIPVNRSEYNVEKPTSHHRTGTATFMSLELLKDSNRTIPHLYRHDLESFMWILIWCSFNFLFNGMELPPNQRSDFVQEWVDISWSRIRKAKKDFLSDYSDALKRTTNVMRPLVPKIVGPLSQSMGRAFSERTLSQTQYEGPSFLRVTTTDFFDLFFTFECFMKIIEPEVTDPVGALTLHER
ncbi:uncharacterized protein STEHIDRAFT_165501 [Stereum hirsutum FP-91666 SS1]|uniref:uncharacterized protein n=1 Tax=Stereum hirsutum (strain FP-91666) TaxID=721885 RepID=UPI000440E8C8|nr:uncharacterized protein STEHIDRAFT_165501 [Stereum hirsutum FP-91666 SS1]EIM91104.1 hypothetical protein STEHIDRAFT_165501 [Stereum hirsutum FP-91666 SS1]